MKRLYLLMTFLSLALLVSFLPAASALACSNNSMGGQMMGPNGQRMMGQGRDFSAMLRGADEVPAVTTDAQGQLVLSFDEGNNALRYRLEVQGMDNVTAAHLHSGARGQNGGVLVPLNTNPNGGVTEGMIRMENLTGNMSGRSLMDLANEIRNGNVYVNVHSNDHPNGEIRGQVQMK